MNCVQIRPQFLITTKQSFDNGIPNIPVIMPFQLLSGHIVNPEKPGPS